MKTTVQSIERAFDILHVVHRHHVGIGVGAVASETGLHTSTTSRIVSTLVQIGALERVGGKLQIGGKIISLANRAPWHERLIAVATPALRELSAETQEAVGLTAIEGNECHVFFQIPSTHHIQIRDWTDERFPLHVTSTGKLYLSQLNERDRERFLAQPLARMASGTRVDSADLISEFPQILADGIAWTIDELEDGLTSIAAPICDATGRFIAGLYISIPNYRLGNKQVLTRQICHTAHIISTQFARE